MKTFTSDTQRRGEIGENIVCMYLERLGFSIVERNFTRKWGEIDIIAQDDKKKLHFIEVKAVSREISRDFSHRFSHETDRHRPEDQMHPWKQARLVRTIATYLAGIDRGSDTDPDWQVDVACVYMDFNRRIGRVEMIDDVILEG